MASIGKGGDSRRIVLITGCSSGIGRSLAIEFARYNASRDYRVFATARNYEFLRSLPAEIDRLQLDVTDEASVDKAVRSIIDQVGRIDVLVNNAGVNTAVGPTCEVDVDRYRSTFEPNFFGLVRLCRQVSPYMIERRSGTIINIGSTVGYLTLPFAAAYSASKAAVHAYSEALRMELAGFGVKVVIVAPGAITSSFGENGTKALVMKKDSAYSDVEDLVKKRANYSQGARSTPTDVFARNVIEKTTRTRSPPAYYITGAKSIGIKFLLSLPHWLRYWIVGRLFGMNRIGKT